MCGYRARACSTPSSRDSGHRSGRARQRLVMAVPSHARASIVNVSHDVALARVSVRQADDSWTVTCPVPGSDASAEFEFRWHDGAWAVRRVAVVTAHEPVTSYVLRRLPLEVAWRAFKVVVHPYVHRGHSQDGWLYSMAPAGTFNAPPLAERKARRPQWTDLDLAHLAQDYVTFLEQADRSPTESLSKARHLTKGRVRSLLSGARKRGLLTTTAPGVAGGSLTDRARRVLSASG